MRFLVIAAAMLAVSLANAQEQRIAQMPWDIESQIRQSPTIKAIQADIQTLRAEHAAMKGGATSTADGKTFTAPASDFTNPTYFYPQGTTMVMQGGQLVPSAAPNAVAYPGQKTRAIGPYDNVGPYASWTAVDTSGINVTQPAAYYYASPEGMFMGGGACANGQCGGGGGGRGLFGRRRR